MDICDMPIYVEIKKSNGNIINSIGIGDTLPKKLRSAPLGMMLDYGLDFLEIDGEVTFTI